MTLDLLVAAAPLNRLVAAGTVAVFDCSFDLADPQAGRDAYLAGHVPGARYLHLDDDLSGRPTGTNGRHPLPDPEDFARTLRAHGLDPGAQVVAYDRSGGAWAARLWWLLRWVGHDAVAVLDGGFQAWTAAGGAVERDEAAAPAPGGFVARPPSPAATVDAADVRAGLGRSDRTIVDARSATRFAGEPNPLDPVAGHIPGAVNRFYGDNLDSGRFKPPATLRREFRALAPEMDTREIVLQCGSGVTACHNALALAIAGVEGARLYPGSWSEWIADPANPVERMA